jgi:hypothetical protein
VTRDVIGLTVTGGKAMSSIRRAQHEEDVERAYKLQMNAGLHVRSILRIFDL